MKIKIRTKHFCDMMKIYNFIIAARHIGGGRRFAIIVHCMNWD